MDTEIAHYLGDGERTTSEVTSRSPEISIQIAQNLGYILPPYVSCIHMETRRYISGDSGGGSIPSVASKIEVQRNISP